MNEAGGRRPLKVRQIGMSQRFARWLSLRNVTPNQISMASVLFAVLVAGCLLAMSRAEGIAGWVLPLLAGLFIQCRLLCNLFDGMVAIEGGKSTPSGELFNDIPDRIADPIILVAAGYSTAVVPWEGSLGGAGSFAWGGSLVWADSLGWGAALGWAAALGAVLTAYVRTLAASIGAPTDFRGPMAKQQRMALMTFACLLTAIEPLFWERGRFLLAALALIALGCGITVVRRARAAYLALEGEVALEDETDA